MNAFSIWTLRVPYGESCDAWSMYCHASAISTHYVFFLRGIRAPGVQFFHPQHVAGDSRNPILPGRYDNFRRS